MVIMTEEYRFYNSISEVNMITFWKIILFLVYTMLVWFGTKSQAYYEGWHDGYLDAKNERKGY